jgi:hypothetical protein
MTDSCDIIHKTFGPYRTFLMSPPDLCDTVHIANDPSSDLPEPFRMKGETMSLPRSIKGLLVVALALLLLPLQAALGDLIQNGGFDTPTPGLSPPNYPTSISGAFTFGASSAAD